jgi:diguanylate cyclase (GGDEF)-like protein
VGGGHCGALLFIDLDHFKRINDSLGHDAGDRVLCEVAARLRAATRAADTVGRLGGDEFVVLIEDLRSVAADNLIAARDIATRVLDQLSGDYRIGAHDYRLSASVGVILFPDAGKDGQTLLQRADAAMYQAKAEGRGRVYFYQRELQAAADARLTLERELRAALAAERFALHYQPQVEGGAIVGAEALLRWQHPDRGLLAPAEFIAVAEQTGLIIDIGAWVIDAACRQLAAWDRSLGSGRQNVRLGLSVNLSPIQLRHQKLTAMVEQALAMHGIEPGRLTLEITEGVLVDNVEEVTRRLQALKDLGVRLSIDDFGIG